MTNTDDTPTPSPAVPPEPLAESKSQRRRRLRRERNRRWYMKHKDARSVLNKTLSDAPNDRLRQQAKAEMRRMGIDPSEVVTLNDLERKVKALENGQSDLRQQFAHLQKALRGSGSHTWTVGDTVICPAPLLQAKNRKAASVTMMVLTLGKIDRINLADRTAVVRVHPGQCVTANLDDMVLRRAAPAGKR